jgi:hypothetical protein
MPEPTYKKLNNPVPQDLSLYDDTQAGQKTDDLSVYNYQDIDGITRFNVGQAQKDGQLVDRGNSFIDEYGRQVINIAPAPKDQGTKNQNVSSGPPEEPYKDYDDAIRRKLRTSPEGSKYLGTDRAALDIGIPGAGGLATTKIKNSKDVSNKTPPVFAADLSTINIDARRNELHNFSSYTYNIALYMMDSKKYIDLTRSPRNIQQVLASSQLLMRSGGVGFQGSELFGDQFYIDDLEIYTVGLAPSKLKHNTNATNISFKVYEPRGVTLLDKLRQQASQFLRTGERYTQAPYLLEVSFKGYDANGTPSTDIVTPKYIPIKITDFDFQVQESGSVYKISAIPFAHFSYGQITSTIPVNLEIKASTIGEIFSSKGKTTTQELTGYRYDDDDEGEGEPQYKTVYGTAPVTLGEALTNHYKNQTMPPQQRAQTQLDSNGETVSYEKLSDVSDALLYDEYKFTIGDAIANATINHADLFEALNSPMPKDNSSSKQADASQFKAYAAGLANQIQLDKETFIFKINAGTDLIKLINLLIMHSSYMDSNILDRPDSSVTSGKPINWFKVNPFLEEFRGYDAKTGNSKYTINYAVVPQAIYGHDFPWAPKSLPPGDGVHKVYNYIFTGLNEDVLKFDLRFDTTYFRTMLQKNGTIDDKPADADFQHQIKYVANSVEGDTTNNSPNLKRSRAKDLFSSMLADGMDLINLDLDIVGDPCYITTSEWLWQDLLYQGRQYESAWMPDNTINFELGTPYILVNFQTPTDYDPITGLADPNRAENSRFSGKYKVMGIESTFSGGVFQQNLSGVRLDLQELRKGQVGKTGTSIGSKERTETAIESEKLTLQNSSGYGEIGRVPRVNGAATVLGTAASEDAYSEIPQTFPLTNTALTADIARGPDQTVNYIEDPDGVSATEQWLSRL